MSTIFRVLLCFFLFTQVSSGQAEAINAFFEKYRDNEDFTQINISPKMFEMFANMDVEMDADTKEVVESLKGLKILSTEKNTRQYYKEFISEVELLSYEELMTIRDGDTDVKFLIKDSESGNIVNELLMIVGGEEDFVMLSFAGRIPIDKIGKIAKNMDFDGSEHLDKLKSH